MPTLQGLLDGRRLLADSAPFANGRASLLALDAELGVKGPPQSATGQAVLLTGRNIPAELGYHYGPSPTPRWPPCWQTAGCSGGCRPSASAPHPVERLPAALLRRHRLGQTAVLIHSAGGHQRGADALHGSGLLRGARYSADFTGQGWRDMLGYPEAQVHGPKEAGEKLSALAAQYELAFFEYWASDYPGHKQDMPWAVRQLETFDGVLAGLLDTWNLDEGLILAHLGPRQHGGSLGAQAHPSGPVAGAGHRCARGEGEVHGGHERPDACRPGHLEGGGGRVEEMEEMKERKREREVPAIHR